VSADSQDILMNAERYWLAAKSLSYVSSLSQSDMAPYHLPDTFGDLDLTQPKMVLELFSIELYLKALLVYRTGSYARTHNLSRLFGDLSADDKNAIESLWVNADFPFSSRFVGPAEYQRKAMTPEEVLYEVRDYFQRWRYSFDRDELEVIASRKNVTPEIFEVPTIIRDYARSVIE